MPQLLNTVRAETTYDLRFTETELATLQCILGGRCGDDSERDGVDNAVEYKIFDLIDDILPVDARL